MKTRDPHGNRWTVRRRWAPWTNYFQAPLNRLNRPLGNELDDHWAGVSAALGRASAVPLIGALLAWVALTLLWPFAVLTRVALRRPWPIDVLRDGELWRSEAASSFSAGREIIERLIDDISYGRLPDRTTTARPPAWHRGTHQPN